MEIQLINCSTPQQANYALGCSWCGTPVRCIFNGVTYDLFADIDENINNGSHAALMALVNDVAYTQDDVKDCISVIELPHNKAIERFFAW